MRVLYLITLAEMGGAQVHVAELLRGYHGHLDLALVAGEEGYLTDTAATLGIPCRIVPDLVHRISPAQDLRATRSVMNILRDLRPDVVHCHTSKAGIVGRVAAGLGRIPVVFTAHAWSFTEGTSWKWKLVGIPSERVAALWTRQIITVSEANRRLAIGRRIAPESRIRTIHNGMPDTQWRAQPDAGGRTRIIMVARCSPPKDQSSLIRALAGVAGDWELQIAGDGPDRLSLEAEVNALGIGDRVSFLGTRSDIPEVLARSHIFALITRYEGFPLSVLEAMRAGLPVVASRVGGVPEAVVDGHTGFLVPHGQQQRLRHVLEQLIHDPTLRLKLGNAGRARYERTFTSRSMLDATYEVYAAAAAHLPPVSRFDHRTPHVRHTMANSRGV